MPHVFGQHVIVFFGSSNWGTILDPKGLVNFRISLARFQLVGGLVAIFYFPIYWVANHPNSEGFKPPTSQYSFFFAWRMIICVRLDCFVIIPRTASWCFWMVKNHSFQLGWTIQGSRWCGHLSAVPHQLPTAEVVAWPSHSLWWPTSPWRIRISVVVLEWPNDPGF